MLGFALLLFGIEFYLPTLQDLVKYSEIIKSSILSNSLQSSHVHLSDENPEIFIFFVRYLVSNLAESTGNAVESKYFVMWLLCFKLGVS